MQCFKIYIISVLLFASGPVAFAKTTKFTISVIVDFETNPAYNEVKDIVTDALKEAGIEVKYQPYPLHRGTTKADEGSIDGELLMTKNALIDHPNLMATQFPIVITPDKIIYLKSNKVFKEADLKSFRGITMLNASATMKKAKEMKLNLLEINSVERQISMLVSGRADYLISPMELVYSYLKSNPSEMAKLEISKNNFLNTSYYFILNKKYQRLMPVIETHLKKIITGDVSKYKFIRQSLNTKWVEHAG